MLLPFKKIIYIAATSIAVISSVLLLFGVRQYLLHRHYQTVIEHSERVIFQFSTIRGHIAQALIEGENLPIEKIINEVKLLNTDISTVLDDVLIPNEYKLNFINQVDLSGIVLLLRSLETAPKKKEKLRELYRQTRLIGDRLQNFDRIIVRYAQARLIGFQSIVIGSLALVVFIVICMVLYLHSQIVDPLINFLVQVRQVEKGKRNQVILRRGLKEMKDLAASFSSFASQKIETEMLLSRYIRLVTAIDQAGRIIDRAKSETEIYTGVCKALLSDEDYCLVWIGIRETPASEHLIPVAADASTTMTSSECKECMSILLTDAEEKGPERNASLQSIRKKEPVVLRDILSDIPMGPFRNTPLAHGYACCAAIPIFWNGTVHGVLNVYSTQKNSFSDVELRLLGRFTRNLGKAVRQLDIQSRLDHIDSLYKQIVVSTNAIIIGISTNGKIMSFNREAERVTGFNQNEVLNRDWLQMLIPPTAHQFIKDGILKTLASDSKHRTEAEIIIRCKDGRDKILKIHFFKTNTPGREGQPDIMLIGQDLTEQHELRRQVSRISLERNQILRHVSHVVIILDVNGSILDANPAALHLLNMEQDLVSGKKFFDLPGISCVYEGNDSPVKRAAESNAPQEFELHIGKDKIYRTKIFPMNSQSEEGLLLLIAEDITDERFRKALAIRTCRMASIGELTASVAHEINNPVNGMINYAQVILDQAIDENRDPEEINLVRRIIGEGERIAEIVTRLLKFSRDQGLKKTPTEITKSIEDSLALVNHQLKMDGIDVKLSMPEDLPKINANPQQLKQVFLNIFNNARYALNIRYPGKNPDKRMEIRGELVRKNNEESLKIYVVDWGIGIDPKVQDKIFEPFFTTKPPEEGTGLGLYISRQLIRDNNGEIHIESVMNDHTTVVIEFPVLSTKHINK